MLSEKNLIWMDLINIGYMVFQPDIFNYLPDESDELPFEKVPMNLLVNDKQLVGYVHNGYWQCMDTLREKQQIENLWNVGNAPWKLWED